MASFENNKESCVACEAAAVEISPEEKGELWEAFTQELKDLRMTADELNSINPNQLISDDWDVLWDRNQITEADVIKKRDGMDKNCEGSIVPRQDGGERVYKEPCRSRFAFYSLLLNYLVVKSAVERLKEKRKKGKMAA